MAKKHHCPHHEEHADETWLIPYADLLTLLLALFIVLFASSNVDKAKVERLAEVFADAFGSTSYMPMTGTIGGLIDDARGVMLDERAALGSDSRGVSIEIGNVDLFDEDGISIRFDALPMLRNVAELLKSDKYARFKVTIEGHTSDLPPQHGFYTSNWELSAARAGVVVSELVKMGLSQNRFTAMGMAGNAPAFPNFNLYGEPIPDNRRRNQRIVIRIEP
jgi:chemotaxis protein MotB